MGTIVFLTCVGESPVDYKYIDLYYFTSFKFRVYFFNYVCVKPAIMKQIHFIILLWCVIAHAQEKTSPIVFADVSLGYSVGTPEGLTGVFGVYYQHNNDLFSLRFLVVEDTSTKNFAPLIPIPIFITEDRVNEYSALYGKRYSSGGHAISFSAGLGLVSREVMEKDNSGNHYYTTSNNIGLPYEVNFKWFKREKAPYRIYGVLPIGGRTAFGNSFGFKLSGAVSKTSYIGIGLCFGIGYHKYY